jgi:aspartate-semialdehyde dehydrogenase
MQDNAIIILDPVNRQVIEQGIAAGKRDLIGGNCTVSLMIMALHGLISADQIEWITAMTYQAISGSGAQHMRELISQMGQLHGAAEHLLKEPSSAILAIDRQVTDMMRSPELATKNIQYPLAGSLLPWIDNDLDNGISREEKKASSETNKILGRNDKDRPIIPIDSICVRVSAMRSHCQAFTIKLRDDIPIDEIEQRLDEANPWVNLIPNNKQDTLAHLTPAYVSGQLHIPVGRVRKLSIGEKYISAFTVGDQLIWGAAEPLRRMLRLAIER